MTLLSKISIKQLYSLNFFEFLLKGISKYFNLKFVEINITNQCIGGLFGQLQSQVSKYSATIHSVHKYATWICLFVCVGGGVDEGGRASPV